MTQLQTAVYIKPFNKFNGPRTIRISIGRYDFNIHIPKLKMKYIYRLHLVINNVKLELAPDITTEEAELLKLNKRYINAMLRDYITKDIINNTYIYIAPGHSLLYHDVEIKRIIWN